MKSLILSTLLLWVSWFAQAQLFVSAEVLDANGDPVPFATVYIDETLEGTVTDIEGQFKLATDHHGAAILVVSAVSYQTTQKDIQLSDDQAVTLKILLNEAEVALDPVTISAGAFEASAKAKAPVLKPLDIVMNAGAEGDIYKAIETLPGVSQVGDQTGLFVRGGDAHETKTIIDGAIVENPFFSEV